jgi:hypothetical protein
MNISRNNEKQERKARAATAVLTALFLGNGMFPKPELTDMDLPLVDQLITTLKNLPGGHNTAHAGEAELIKFPVEPLGGEVTSTLRSRCSGHQGRQG